MENQIEQQLKEVLSREYGEPVGEGTSISDLYDLDSLSVLEFYLIVEEAFEIEVPSEMKKLNASVSDVALMISELKK